MKSDWELSYDSFFELMHAWNQAFKVRYFKRNEIDRIFHDDLETILEREDEIMDLIYYTVAGETSEGISKDEKKLGVILFQKLKRAHRRNGTQPSFSSMAIKSIGRIKRNLLAE
jgi:hypothetical protein